jgi:hypothetical protein
LTHDLQAIEWRYGANRGLGGIQKQPQRHRADIRALPANIFDASIHSQLPFSGESGGIHL